MKTQSFLILLIALILLNSCAMTNYYQVYKVQPDKQINRVEDLLIYEDENCMVYYNLWENEGNPGFRFYNKTNENIYLLLNESFFVQNGIAYDYFRNRTFTKTSNIGANLASAVGVSESISGVNYLNLFQTNKLIASGSSGISSSKGFSVSEIENEVICIPSKTSKIISEYSINDAIYRDCNLFRYPKNQINTTKFSKENTPLVFSNRLVYTVGKSESPINIENEFYVTEITNYPENKMGKMKADEYCDEKGTTLYFYFNETPPDRFYIKYTKELNSFAH